ncbi:MAG TPA: hypothetical protein VKN76_18495 [Kiloniellaceae bacterium]|nr:hypothetical protein [Kiloniellaceae bacterium]
MKTFLFFLSVVLMPFAAEAGCTKGDTAGIYQGYATSTRGSTEWMVTCTVSVNDRGRLKKGTACKRVFPGGSVETGIKIVGGRLSVNSACKVTGYLLLDFNGATSRSDVVQATLSQDSVDIVGILANDDGSISLFSAVRK